MSVMCAYCGYVNTQHPPVRVVCIACAASLVPPGAFPPFGRTALDKRAKYTFSCYDPMGQRRIEEGQRVRKKG